MEAPGGYKVWMGDPIGHSECKRWSTRLETCTSMEENHMPKNNTHSHAYCAMLFIFKEEEHLAMLYNRMSLGDNYAKWNKTIFK